MKVTPKKRKVLRHGAISFTGNTRRRRDESPRPQRTGAPSDTGAKGAPSRSPAENVAADETRDDQRLQKVLASAGIGSRRECEELILAGRVEVDGEPVTKLGVRVDSRKQKITLDGEPVKFQRRTYYAINKPTGVLSTNSDPSGRIRVVDLIGGEQRLFTVGRLDQHSEGLIIVTNDGELTQRLTHPKYGVPKVYNVQVAGEAGDEVVTKLLAGVRLEEGIAKAARATIRKRTKSFSILEMVLTEGRNREIRRMLAQLDHKVQRLTRIAVGPIRLGKLKPGQFRMLDTQEVKDLKDLAFQHGGAEAEPAPRSSRPPRSGGAQRSGEAPRNKFKPRREGTGDSRPPSTDRRQQRSGGRPMGRPEGTSAGTPTGMPAGRPAGKRTKFTRGATGRPAGNRVTSDRVQRDGVKSDRVQGDRPKFERKTSDRPKFDRQTSDRKANDRVTSDRPKFDRVKRVRPKHDRPKGGRPTTNRPTTDRPITDRPKWSRDSRSAPPVREFDLPAKKPHPLPFLKQGIVLDENDAPIGAPTPAQPPRAGNRAGNGRPGRKKPLRRLRARRGKN